MPSSRPQLTVAAARDLVAEQCLTPTDEQTGRVGIEAEWLVLDPADPNRGVPLDEVRAAADAASPLPGRSRITFEPGAQVELSTTVFRDAGAAIDALATDGDALSARFTAAGLTLLARGIDPARRPHRRFLMAPRYDAMEAFFDRRGSAGRRMMCATAGLQVNLDLGPPDEVLGRWRRAQALGPVLAATFANSPMADGPTAGWASARLATWLAIDPSRTAPVAHPSRPGSWADYALDASVMCIRLNDQRYVPVDEHLSFRSWLRDGHPLGHPDADDLEYHLTTLFPPVRPRGWLEVRYLDALPDPWWPVAVAVLTALLDDADAAGAADRAVAGTEALWAESASAGLRDQRLAAAALMCFDAALPALDRIGVDGDTTAAAKEYRDRFVARRRCPGDEVEVGWEAGQPWWWTPPAHGDPVPAMPAARPQPTLAATGRRAGCAETAGGGKGALMPTPDLKARIVAELDAVRSRSLDLLEPVPEPDLLRQISPIMSPLVWDLAHVGNYEEQWLLGAVAGQRAAAHLDDLYDAFAHPRPERPSLPILRPPEARVYIADVRGRVLDALDRTDLAPERPLLSGGFVYGMVAQHEHQHAETMLATLHLRGGDHPIAHVAPARPAPTPPAAPEVLIPGGRVTIGTSSDPWAYDNERPAHEIDVAPFHLDTTPVTNARFAAFIEAGGYDEPRWWTARGWAHRCEAGLTAPMGWAADGAGGWTRTRFGVVEAVPPDEPVQHVCWFEADAFARWAGRRLPTEAEWEVAASVDTGGRKRRWPWGEAEPTSAHANLWPGSAGPAPVGSFPAGVSAHGVHGLIGDVWEWTSSGFEAYPGFRSFPYAEYSEVFLGGDFKVLRGGSWATSPVAVRSTFRDWDLPIRRQIFAGFRCARDA